MLTFAVSLTASLVSLATADPQQQPRDPVTPRRPIEGFVSEAKPAPGDPDGPIVEIVVYREEHTDEAVDRLEEYPELEVLALCVDNLTDEHLAKVGRLSRLKHLVVNGSPAVSDRGLARLSELEELQTLHLYRVGVTDDGLETLSGLTRLEVLSLDSARVTDGGLAHLAPLVNLRELGLSGTSVRGPGFRALAGATLLRQLDLSYTPAEDLRAVGELPNLRSLFLDGCTRLTDAAVAGLAPLAELHTLVLRDVPLRGTTLSVVTRHGRLTSLHLDGTGVGAAAVEALVRPGRLESLSLGGAEITEEDTLRIARAHSGLRYLQPPEGWRADSWDRLREALPRLHGPGCGFQFCGNDVAIERARRTRTDETTPLMDAVVRREHARLASLLRRGADPNERSPSDAVTGAAATDLLTESDVYPPVTLLHAACALGDEVAVDRLLAAGADPTLGLDDGRRPIDAAAERGAASIVRRLLAAGATPSAGDRGGSSGVLGALENGHIDVARVLMEAGHEPPLDAVFLAVRNALGQRRLEQAAEILAVGNVDLEDLDHERTRSLFSAASIDPRPRAVELLLAAGADPNVGDSRAMTPLHDAASRGRVEVARLLLAAGADRHARNSAGWTAAMFARRAGAEALAAALETDGETIADRRRAELFRALDKNDVAEFEALLKAGADPNGRGPGYDNGKDLLGRPILLHAIADQRLDCAVALIDAGADVDATDEFGRNALWFARQFADDRVVEALQNAGATEEGT